MEELLIGLGLGGGSGIAATWLLTRLRAFWKARGAARVVHVQGEYDVRIDQLSELARDRYIVHRANTNAFHRGRLRQAAPEMYERARALLGWQDE